MSLKWQPVGFPYMLPVKSVPEQLVWQIMHRNKPFMPIQITYYVEINNLSVAKIVNDVHNVHLLNKYYLLG